MTMINAEATAGMADRCTRTPCCAHAVPMLCALGSLSGGMPVWRITVETEFCAAPRLWACRAVVGPCHPSLPCRGITPLMRHTHRSFALSLHLGFQPQAGILCSLRSSRQATGLWSTSTPRTLYHRGIIDQLSPCRLTAADSRLQKPGTSPPIHYYILAFVDSVDT
jgi:hypothetical protein